MVAGAQPASKAAGSELSKLGSNQKSDFDRNWAGCTLRDFRE